MEIITFIVFIALFVIFGLIVSSLTASKRKVFKNNKYNYLVKPSPMTRTEGEFFFKLDRIVSDRYYVFPQVHLSSILDHHVKGQEWKYAFSHINGKSVDYVLCDKQTLQPVYAIELDDYTHDKSDRRERDIEVERIFQQAQLPLIRIRNKDISDSEIIQAFTNARARLS